VGVSQDETKLVYIWCRGGGAKPGDIRIEQPTKFEYVLDPRTAKGLVPTIAPSLLRRADQVIE
jgi:putative ABC transport system substrate-binding protein